MTASDGRIPGGAGGDGEEGEEGEEGDAGEEDEKMDEDEALKEIGKPQAPGKAPTREEMGIPALDEDQEYEWKWKPKMEVSRRTFFL